jgi:hypothetical protein
MELVRSDEFLPIFLNSHLVTIALGNTVRD